MSRNKAEDFLANMRQPAAEPPPKPARQRPAAKPAVKASISTKAAEASPAAPAARHHSREGRKQVCGFLDEATLEILAVLRVRLKMDNTQLITYALEELDRSHKAKRAFGDA